MNIYSRTLSSGAGMNGKISMISNTFSDNGAVESSSNSLENQSLTGRCGQNSPIEAIEEISQAPAPARKAMFINDEELRERFGLDAEIIIDKLDHDPKTQKGLATRPVDVRYRPAVDAKLKELGHG